MSATCVHGCAASLPCLASFSSRSLAERGTGSPPATGRRGDGRGSVGRVCLIQYWPVLEIWQSQGASLLAQLSQQIKTGDLSPANARSPAERCPSQMQAFSILRASDGLSGLGCRVARLRSRRGTPIPLTAEAPVLIGSAQARARGREARAPSSVLVTQVSVPLTEVRAAPTPAAPRPDSRVRRTAIKACCRLGIRSPRRLPRYATRLVRAA
jgi:hypothetical protein